MIPFLLKLTPKTPKEFAQVKRIISAKFNIPMPTNSTLIKAYRAYLEKSNKKSDPALMNLLKRRQMRTGSGVAPIAILTKPYPCPGKCIYCPDEKDMPKSYLSNEPAVMRAIMAKFDPKRQIGIRLSALEANGHNTDKIELIIMGGTWSYLPKNYQLKYIIKCFEACNEFGGKIRISPSPFNKGECKLRNKGQYLLRLQKQNEKSAHRIVGLTLETRPDYITSKEIKRMRQFGATRVELGVQAIDDKILSISKRGHGVKEIIAATKQLRRAGFKICYHMMVNMPGSDPKKDYEMFRKLFSDSAFQPDQIKIYPCVITKNASLFRLYKLGKYKPYSHVELIELLKKIKQMVPPHVRIIRVIRDIPTTSIIAGNKISNLRETIGEILARSGKKCQCIRCREIGNSKIQSHKLIIRKIDLEYFISYEDIKQNKLIAFLRLSLAEGNEGKIYNLFPSLKGAAIIREVHTYGPAIKIGIKDKKATQHLGFGKKLIRRAEKIALSKGFKKIAVISGIGAREYYRKLGYKLKDTYMVKSLEKK